MATSVPLPQQSKNHNAPLLHSEIASHVDLRKQLSLLCFQEHKRKAWLFANTPKGARASAIIYSIVESAIANGLNPYYYLRYLFEKLPNMDLTDENALDKLLPWSTSIPVNCIFFNKLTNSTFAD